ncbi:hypothetical protein RIF29_15295 [Crotalaria pallida]|uniref:Uncharacterized protein n=1 Tax=Crotalaria pallida TaxID=3830 RepID=A0AAN9FDA5_CROPI
MSLLPFAFAGGGFILIGAHESLDATLFSTPKSQSQSQSSSSFFFISLSIFSSSFILNSLISLFDAANSNDAVGTSLQLQLLPIPLIFLLFSLLSLLNTHLGLPSPLLSLLATYAFVSEFLSFYLHRKDAGGVENRYYDLLLVPIAACVLCTCIEWRQSPSRNVAKLGRGIALVLQGT